MVYLARIVLLLAFFVSSLYGAENDKTVLLSILARNKAHILPYYLTCLENLDYDKHLITIYINTNNNSDDTKKILLHWAETVREKYNDIIFENKDFHLDSSTPHEWTEKRLQTLGKIRNQSLLKTLEYNCDYYFVVDCDNFIAPFTLKALIKKNKPIIAPMLYSVPDGKDVNGNFFYAVTPEGYYSHADEYYKILHRQMVGTFKVPLVHCTYLIKAEHIPQLTYTNGTGEYEFIIFSRSARESGIDQFICNEADFGTNLNFSKKLTLEEEQQRVKSMPLSQFMLE